MTLKQYYIKQGYTESEAEEIIQDIKNQMTYGEDVTVILQERGVPALSTFIRELEG